MKMPKKFLLLFILILPSIATADSLSLFKNEKYNAAFRESYLNLNAESGAKLNDYIVLGKIYTEGLGASKQNLEQAKHYLDIAIGKGSIEAALFLANEYETGKTFKRNLFKAINYYKKAKNLGRGNLETKIAVLYTKAADGAIGKNSCPAIIDAAKKQDKSFYILAARCLADQPDEIETARSYLKSSFLNFQKEKADKIINLLIKEKSNLYSPSTALYLISSMSEKLSTQRSVLFEIAFNEISIAIDPDEFSKSTQILQAGYVKNPNLYSDLSRLVKIGLDSHNPELSLFTLNFIKKSLITSMRPAQYQGILMELVDTLERKRDGQEDIFTTNPEEFIETANILLSGYRTNPNLYPALSRLMKIGLNSQNPILYSITLEFIKNSLSNSLRTVQYQGILLQLVDTVERKADEQEGLITIEPEEFIETAQILIAGYNINPNLYSALIRLLQIGVNSHNPILSSYTLNVLENPLSESQRSTEYEKMLLALISSVDRKGDVSESILVFLGAMSDDFYETYKNNVEKLIEKTNESTVIGNCLPALLVFKNGNFSVALEIKKIILENKPNCIAGNLKLIQNGFLNYPQNSSASATFALKGLCDNDYKNGCHALGTIYKLNHGDVYTDSDARELALAAFELGIRNNSSDSALEIAFILSEKGNNKDAIKMAKRAYNDGLVGGLYVEAKIRLKGFFSASSESCKPLNRYLVEATISNRFFADAKLLQKKKNCGSR